MNRLGASGSLVLLLDKSFSSCGGEGRRKKKKDMKVSQGMFPRGRECSYLCVCRGGREHCKNFQGVLINTYLSSD